MDSAEAFLDRPPSEQASGFTDWCQDLGSDIVGVWNNAGSWLGNAADKTVSGTVAAWHKTSEWTVEHTPQEVKDFVEWEKELAADTADLLQGWFSLAAASGESSESGYDDI